VLVSNRQIDPASYEDYLRAAALIRKSDTSIPLDPAIALLEGVVTRQPNYAPAWALLSGAYFSSISFDPAYQRGSVEWLRRAASAALPKAEAAARRAIKLDARNADAYAALGIVQGSRGKWFDSEQSLKRALNLDPLNPHVLSTYSAFLAITGQIKPAIAMREKLTELDPLVPPYNNFTARLLLTMGDTDKALTIAQTMPIGSAERASALMRIYAARKQYKEAAASIHSYPAGRVPPGNVALAERLLRTAPSPAPHQDFPYMGGLSIVYLYVGIPERALEVMEYPTDAGFIPFAALAEFWELDFAPARKTERFKNLIRKLGLVDYWRARGWPQYCHPVSTDDFACN
jgi:tetratricopeptide (TPR) repeat protein